VKQNYAGELQKFRAGERNVALYQGL